MPSAKRAACHIRVVASEQPDARARSFAARYRVSAHAINADASA